MEFTLLLEGRYSLCMGARFRPSFRRGSVRPASRRCSRPDLYVRTPASRPAIARASDGATRPANRPMRELGTDARIGDQIGRLTCCRTSCNAPRETHDVAVCWTFSHGMARVGGSFLNPLDAKSLVYHYKAKIACNYPESFRNQRKTRFSLRNCP